MASASPSIFTILPRAARTQIAFRLTLLDNAVIRSNGPDEVMTRRVDGVDHFVLPATKIRHMMREFVEMVQRNVGIGGSCRAQHYCSSCPSCWIFGTFGASGDNKQNWSLGSRLEMSEALDLNPSQGLIMRTRNSVEPITQTTGRAGLTKMNLIPAGTEFYGELSIEGGNPDVEAIVVAALRGIGRIGAATTNFGRCCVEILALRRGFTEVASWAPMNVVRTQRVPTNDGAATFPTPEAEDYEQALVDAVTRLHTGVVTVAVNEVLKVSPEFVKAVKEIVNHLAAVETGKGFNMKKFIGALKSAVYNATGETKDRLNEVKLELLGEKDTLKPSVDAVRSSADLIRAALIADGIIDESSASGPTDGDDE